jgi:hypothetical protein
VPTLSSVLELAPWLFGLLVLLAGGALVVGRATRKPGQHQPHRRELPPRPEHRDLAERVEDLRAEGEARREDIVDAADPDSEVSPADVWNRRRGR